MEKYQYREMTTNKVVEDFMAEEYVKNELGLKIIPKGENGTLTLEQQEFLESTVDWYFSGNWIEEIVNEDIPDLEHELEIEEKIYQDNLERKWGLV